MTKTIGVVRTVAVLGLIGVLSACGGTSKKTTTTTTATTSTTVTGSSTTAPGATTTAVTTAATSRCHTSELAAANDGNNGAAGSIYSVIKLTNQSTRTCTLFGWAGLALVDSGGHIVSQPVARDLTALPGNPPAVVTLAPGASGYFTWRYTDVQSSPTDCPTATSIWVTPPDETDHLTLAPDGGSVKPCQAGAIDESPVRASA